MMLLVGLGNPGASYARNRHNVGFMAMDGIASRHGFGPWRARFDGELSEGRIGADKALLLKPLTFMNESGRSVGAAIRFFKLAPVDVVVFHDELDLAPGKVRAKTGGGVAGHNGLKSISAHIGPEFRRVRIGIGHPGHKSRVSGHVLGDFAKMDADWLEPMLEALASEIAKLAEGDSAYAGAVGQRLAPPARPSASSSMPGSSTGPASVRTPPPADPAVPEAHSALGDALKSLLKK